MKRRVLFNTFESFLEQNIEAVVDQASFNLNFYAPCNNQGEVKLLNKVFCAW